MALRTRLEYFTPSQVCTVDTLFEIHLFGLKGRSPTWIHFLDPIIFLALFQPIEMFVRITNFFGFE